MKKIILAIVMTAYFVSQINAQVNFGIKGGLNFDKFKIDYKDPKGSAAEQFKLANASGWQAGALLQIKIPIIGIGIQPELLYTVKKANLDGKTNSINYFEVPVNFQWGPDLLIVRPFVMFGPYFGYAVSLKGNKFDKLKKEQIENFDWGIGVGAGLDIWKFQLGARYSWGMKDVVGDVTDVDDLGLENLKQIKNRTLSLSLAYKF